MFRKKHILSHIYLSLPIQDPPEQFPVNASRPTQYRPPLEGLGDVQDLVR